MEKNEQLKASDIIKLYKSSHEENHLNFLSLFQGLISS